MPVPASPTDGAPPPPPPRLPVPRDATSADARRRSRGTRWTILGIAAALIVLLTVAVVALGRGGREATSTPTAPPPSSSSPSAPPQEVTAGPSPPGTAPSPEAPTADPPLPGTALAALERLAVTANETFEGYDRDLFGYRSVDLDRNGCDVRNDVLRRDLADVVVRPGTNGCVVETGILVDPYTGAVMAFQRGAETSGQVQIDHVVALANAWVTGAQSWDEATLERFGNDPLNLLAVDGPTNQGKGADDASEWLPANTGFRCEYVALQVAVKGAYALTVTAAERDAMVEVLETCPAQPLPTAADTATP
ncbi:HNH endonuclease [Occultella glacieicola]|uniref:HNH endonuclease n=1 Tax=Occultella glacieicola TaxID=2518684 RepID=A0ABY2E2E3_9MICO|nr:HNH endonuclease family protein [Occultella glacieicola]TDE92636.1 HNH endonuclease [Occultella glacieicola]